MSQTAQKDSLDKEDIVEHDEDIDEQIEWEEELEKEYGGLDESMDERRSGAMGPGFSKQKQVMEENQYYRGDVKRKVSIKNKTKK